MSKNYLLPENGEFYKANLHCHTTCSDGSLTPKQIKELYKKNGYSAVAFSDHYEFHYHKELMDKDFIPLAAYELNYDDYSGGGLTKTCHINAIAKDPENCSPIEGSGTYSIDNINNAVSKLNDNGFIVNINHPVWSAMPMEEVFSIKGVLGMEIFNSAEHYLFGNIGDEAFYDFALKKGMRLMPIMSDDNHGGQVINGEVVASVEECRACVMLKAEELSYNGLIQSLINGDYYCTTGPLIYNLYIENDKLCIECSPVRRAFLRSNFIFPWEVKEASDELFTYIEFDISKYRDNAKYIRIKIMDDYDKIAFTTPYYF